MIGIESDLYGVAWLAAYLKDQSSRGTNDASLKELCIHCHKAAAMAVHCYRQGYGNDVGERLLEWAPSSVKDMFLPQFVPTFDKGST